MSGNEEQRPFFTIRSLATRLSISERTVRNYIARGELASYQLGRSRRIDPADVDSFLADRRDDGLRATK